MATKTKKLTKAQRRVQIAKDVLKWVKAGRINADARRYLVLGTTRNLSSEYPLDKAVGLTKKPCTVCAVGAMLYAHVVKNDGVSVGEWEEAKYEEKEFIARTLRESYSEEEIEYIEQVFEGNHTGDAEGEFHFNHPDRTDRLKAMFEIMAKNGGTFTLKESASC